MLDTSEIISLLPHRPPFLFVDRVVEFESEKSIVAEHLVSSANPIMQGGFPSSLPNVVQVEAMAQACALLGCLSGKISKETHHTYFLKIDEAEFSGTVFPGDVLRIEIELLRLGRVSKFRGECSVRGERRCFATLTAAFEPKKTE